jgi:hypothetical protein
MGHVVLARGKQTSSECQTDFVKFTIFYSFLVNFAIPLASSFS